MDYRAPNGVFSGDERVLVFQEIKVFWIKKGFTVECKIVGILRDMVLVRF
jgi:hypothetical protein